MPVEKENCLRKKKKSCFCLTLFNFWQKAKSTGWCNATKNDSLYKKADDENKVVKIEKKDKNKNNKASVVQWQDSALPRRWPGFDSRQSQIFSSFLKQNNFNINNKTIQAVNRRNHFLCAAECDVQALIVHFWTACTYCVFFVVVLYFKWQHNFSVCLLQAQVFKQEQSLL